MLVNLKRFRTAPCVRARLQPCRKTARNLLGFTGCGKTRSGGRRGFQPPHKANRINAGFSPGGTLFDDFARNPEFFRSLFSPRGMVWMYSIRPSAAKAGKLAPSSAPFGKLRAGFEAAPFQNIEIFPQPLKSVPFIHHAKNPNAIALLPNPERPPAREAVLRYRQLSPAQSPSAALASFCTLLCRTE